MFEIRWSQIVNSNNVESPYERFQYVHIHVPLHVCSRNTWPASHNSHLISRILYFTAHVSYQIAYFIFHNSHCIVPISYLISRISNITQHFSYVISHICHFSICHISLLIFPMSYLICHVSKVVYKLRRIKFILGSHTKPLCCVHAPCWNYAHLRLALHVQHSDCAHI